jgi:hypothetical protein
MEYIGFSLGGRTDIGLFLVHFQSPGTFSAAVALANITRGHPALKG